MLKTSANVKLFLDNPKVIRALGKKNATILRRTGGYTKTVMRNSMKKATAVKEVTVAVDDDGNEVFIDDKGRVRSGNGRYLPKAQAARARARMANAVKKRVGGGAKKGEPPRYRKGGLRNNLEYSFDPQRQSVVAGAIAFRSKTKPGAGMTTPELLNEGGFAQVATPTGMEKSNFEPHPFTPPAFEAGQKFFTKLVSEVPLK